MFVCKALQLTWPACPQGQPDAHPHKRVQLWVANQATERDAMGSANHHDAALSNALDSFDLLCTANLIHHNHLQMHR